MVGDAVFWRVAAVEDESKIRVRQAVR